MNTQVKTPEFIDFNVNLVQMLLQVLQNYPFKEVAILIKSINDSEFDKERKIFRVPYAIADTCYLILSREPVVIAVKTMEKIAVEAQQAAKIQDTAISEPEKPKKPEVKPGEEPENKKK